MTGFYMMESCPLTDISGTLFLNAASEKMLKSLNAKIAIIQKPFS